MKSTLTRDFASLLPANIWLAGGFAGFFGVLALRLPPLAIVSAAFVVLTALAGGFRRGILTVGIGGVLVGAGWWLMGTPPGMAFPLVLTLWPPVLAMAEALRRTQRLGPALQIAGGVMLGFVLIMHLATKDVAAFWEAWVQRSVAALPAAVIPLPDLKEALRLLNGFFALVYGLSLMLSLVLGRWWLSLAFNAAGFAAEFRELSLPRWLLALTVALIWIGEMWDRLLLADLLMVAILLYGFVGLAVIHGVIAVRGASRRWLIPVYLLLFLLPPQALVTLAVLGAVDVYVHFRVQEGQS